MASQRLGSTLITHYLLFLIAIFSFVFLLGWEYWSSKTSPKVIVKRFGHSQRRRPIRSLGNKVYSEDPFLVAINIFRNALPGMKKRSYELAVKMYWAYKKKRGHRLHTRFKTADGWPLFTNRLIFESSPYLLQHAHNPVNWYAWRPEAFERARRENKPILLSIGYSTCHWCHVMARESFEDEEIAAYLNRHYIAIKVDREERPDIDSVYMKFLQTMTGRGGWPMTIWLTPSKKPFFAGTYFPPRNRWGMRGFLNLLKLMHLRFRNKKGLIELKAKQWLLKVHQSPKIPSIPGLPTSKSLFNVMRMYSRFFDEKNGGLQRRMKFPSTLPHRLLLRYFRRTGDKRVLEMVTHTLDKMARGGIHDQVGGGFHRYATDPYWLIPHFEKMLYDNALIADDYLTAYLVTKRVTLRGIVVDILDYIAKEMTSPDGAFYSATDADSEGKEGAFFVWKAEEFDAILGSKLSKEMKLFFGVTRWGNFHGANVLYRPWKVGEAAKLLNVSTKYLESAIWQARRKLYEYRLRRPHPFKDTKIITSWNALMISSFIKTSFYLNRPDYRHYALQSLRFLLKNLLIKGRLRHSYKDGRTSAFGYLEDYAFLIRALLDTFEVTQDLAWFRQAIALQKVLQKHYWDSKKGGYFRTSDDQEQLLIRQKPHYDGAIPTGNSIQAMNLLRLHLYTSDVRYKNLALALFKTFGRRLALAPTSMPVMLSALEFFYDEPKEIVLIKPKSSTSVEPFLSILRKIYLPNRIILIVEEEQRQRWKALFPILSKRRALNGRVTSYVCVGKRCELPTNEPKIFERQILQKLPLKFPPIER